MSTIIGQVECAACGEKSNVQEAKRGALTIYCNGQNGCGAQTFVKSPKAVERLRTKLSGQSPNGTGGPAVAKRGLLDEFK